MLAFDEKNINDSVLNLCAIECSRIIAELAEEGDFSHKEKIKILFKSQCLISIVADQNKIDLLKLLKEFIDEIALDDWEEEKERMKQLIKMKAKGQL